MSLPYPSGWFCLAASAELNATNVLTRRIGGTERVLFRDAEGKAAALHAYCTHLGAHFGHGGKVVDGTLQCPFHAFRFDRAGVCVATGYNTRPPKALCVKSWPVVETGGWIFSWFHPEDKPPTWEIPTLDTEGWTTVQHTMVPLATHPQETTENSVDFGHFAVVHGYRDATMNGLEVEGQHLHTSYRFVRPDGIPMFGKNIEIHIDAHVWGLGLSYVNVSLPQLKMKTRQFVLPTAVGDRACELRLGMAVWRDHTWLPAWAIDQLAPVMMRSYIADVMQDRHIWENKIHIERPILADGDGPVGRYRVWCRQFYG